MAAEARVEVVALLKLEVPGVPTAQVVAVARREAKLERQEPQELLALMDAVMVAEAAGGIQVPVLEEQEPLAVRQAEEVVAVGHLTLVLVAQVEQVLMAWHESIVGR